jgi:hypothetical protein
MAHCVGCADLGACVGASRNVASSRVTHPSESASGGCGAPARTARGGDDTPGPRGRIAPRRLRRFQLVTCIGPRPKVLARIIHDGLK